MGDIAGFLQTTTAPWLWAASSLFLSLSVYLWTKHVAPEWAARLHARASERALERINGRLAHEIEGALDRYFSNPSMSTVQFIDKRVLNGLNNWPKAAEVTRLSEWSERHETEAKDAHGRVRVLEAEMDEAKVTLLRLDKKLDEHFDKLTKKIEQAVLAVEASLIRRLDSIDTQLRQRAR